MYLYFYISVEVAQYVNQSAHILPSSLLIQNIFYLLLPSVYIKGKTMI